MEKILVMVKPDGIEAKIIGLTLSEIEYANLKVTRLEQRKLSKEEAEALYAEYKGKDFFDRNIDHIISGPVVLIEVEGDMAVNQCRQMIEDFRHRFVNVIKLPKNLLHATSDPARASVELEAVFGKIS